MTWITAPLYSGPLGSNTYNYDITGLTANTKYIYRAYFIVSGVTYYGNILTGTTAALAIVPPTVLTGINKPPLETSVLVISNKVTNDGGAPVVEKGLLYTQLGFWGTDSNLIYANVPTYVKKVSGTTTGSTFSAEATGLTPSTTVYYRAFAKTAAGVGYGDIDTVVTVSPPPPPSVNMLYIYGAENNGVNDACNAGELSHPSGSYTACICWKMYKGETTGSPESMSVEVYCNGYLKHSITCNCKVASSCWVGGSSGYFPSFSVSTSDTVVVCAFANIYHTATLGNCATGRLSSVSPYSVGSPNCTTAYTCSSFGAPLTLLLV